MKKPFQRNKRKKGYISIMTIVFLAFFIPFTIFIGIQLPKMYGENSALKDTVDNISGSVITRIDDNRLTKGNIQINEAEAVATAQEMFKSEMNLNDDFTPKNPDAYVGNPKLDVVVINDPLKTPVYKTEKETIEITNPTVIVTATVTYKKIGIMGRDITMQKTGMSQVQFK